MRLSETHAYIQTQPCSDRSTTFKADEDILASAHQIPYLIEVLDIYAVAEGQLREPCAESPYLARVTASLSEASEFATELNTGGDSHPLKIWYGSASDEGRSLLSAHIRHVHGPARCGPSTSHGSSLRPLVTTASGSVK